MPTAPPRPCAEPGCPVLVATGRCARHARAYDRARGTSADRLYGHRWRRASERFRQRYPLCGMRPNGARPVMSQCFDEGRVTPAEQVDHVIPHRRRLALFWDESNWQSLCGACGRRKTGAGL